MLGVYHTMKLAVRWLPWAVAGLLALLVLLAPRGTEGLAVHNKAVACVESGKIWLNGQCCSSYDGTTQKCKKGSSGGGSSSSSGKKGSKSTSSSSGKKGSKTTGKTTTRSLGVSTSEDDDEPKPKNKTKSTGGGGGKSQNAKYHFYNTNGSKNGGSVLDDTACHDFFAANKAKRAEVQGKPWVAITSGFSQSKCGKKVRITNKASGKAVQAYIVDISGHGGVDMDQEAFIAIDTDGENGGNGKGVAAGNMAVTVEEL